jgi:hypothetical protein
VISALKIAPLALAVVALTMLVFFDLGPPLAFNDDWMYAWAAQKLASGHLALFPASSALALTQIGWATIVTLGHTDARLLRLSVIPFVALLAFSTFQVARRLGAGSFWSGMAGVGVTASPLFIANATSFMSDIPYTALVMAAAWNGLRWQQDGRGKAWTVFLVVAATAQRQIGAFIVPALTAAMWLSLRSEPPRSRRWVAVGALWLATIAAVLLPQALGLTPAAASTRLSHIAMNPVVVAIDLLVLPGEIGLALIPFVLGLLTIRYVRPSRDHRGPALIALAGAIALILITHAGLPITSDGFQPMGLMDVQASNPQTKQLLYPWPLFQAVMAVALVSFAVFSIWRWGAWRAVGPAGVTLVAVAVSQLVPWFISPHFAYDRYYLPIAAPLVPLGAWLADQSMRPSLAQAWAVGALAFGLALYAVGEQDYQAWQQSRDATARLAYQTTSPEYVSAGYEANAVYWELPYYDRTGKDVSGWSDRSGWDFAVLGPRQPQTRLVFAAADDPRPGFRYESLSPGKVVIQAVANNGQ